MCWAEQFRGEEGGKKGRGKDKWEDIYEASGKPADPDALIGKGEIFLRDGRVQQYSLLVLLGEILQFEELRELLLEQAHAKYRVIPGLVTFYGLILRSQNIILLASGQDTFYGFM